MPKVARFQDRLNSIIDHCVKHEAGYWIENGTIFCIKSHISYFRKYFDKFSIDTFRRQLHYYDFSVVQMNGALWFSNENFNEFDRTGYLERNLKYHSLQRSGNKRKVKYSRMMDEEQEMIKYKAKQSRETLLQSVLAHIMILQGQSAPPEENLIVDQKTINERISRLTELDAKIKQLELRLEKYTNELEVLERISSIDGVECIGGISEKRAEKSYEGMYDFLADGLKLGNS